MYTNQIYVRMILVFRLGTDGLFIEKKWIRQFHEFVLPSLFRQLELVTQKRSMFVTEWCGSIANWS